MEVEELPALQVHHNDEAIAGYYDYWGIVQYIPLTLDGEFVTTRHVAHYVEESRFEDLAIAIYEDSPDEETARERIESALTAVDQRELESSEWARYIPGLAAS